MKMYIELTNGEELVTSFSFAGAVYSLCKGNGIDVTTVANMLLLEATNESNSQLYNSQCCERSDTNDR